MFAKNERGYRLTAKNYRWWLQLILLLSVASKRRKLVKTTHTKERSVITKSEICNFRLDRKRIILSPNKSFRYYNPYNHRFFPRRIRIYLIYPNIFDFLKLIFHLQLVFTTGAGFSNIPGKYENVVFIIKKILETGINVFKSNSQIMKNKKILWNINYMRMRRKIIDDYWL